MATEQIIHPISPPPNAPKYYYPGLYYYTPEPYQTTHIPKHHHHVVPAPLKHAVHDFVHPFGDGFQLPAPHCDIRETKAAYYIDVEVPGLRDPKGVKLRWTGTRSLFVEGRIEREKIVEEGEENATTTTTAAGAAGAAGVTGASVNAGAAEEEGTSSSSSSSSSSESDKKKKKEKKRSAKKEDKKKKGVHFLKKERKTGELARAFNFPVDVEQERTVAKLAYGVLSVMVPKKVKEGEEGHREVEVQHAGQ